MPPLIPGYYCAELDQFLKRTLDEINKANGADANYNKLDWLAFCVGFDAKKGG